MPNPFEKPSISEEEKEEKFEPKIEEKEKGMSEEKLEEEIKKEKISEGEGAGIEAKEEEELERIKKEIKETPEEGKGKMEEKQIKEGLKKTHQKIAEPKEKEKREISKKINEVVEIPEGEKIWMENLISDNSEKSWEAREAKEKDHKEIVATVAGIKSEKAEEYLKARLGKEGKQKKWKVICAGLMFNDTEWADEIREWLRYDKEVGRVRGGINANIIKSLGLNKSEWFFNFRKVIDKFHKGFYLPGDLLLSEIGVSAENPMKKKLLEEFGRDFPAEAILSFLGDSSPQAQEMVKTYYERDKKKLKWAYEKWLKSREKEK